MIMIIAITYIFFNLMWYLINSLKLLSEKPQAHLKKSTSPFLLIPPSLKIQKVQVPYLFDKMENFSITDLDKNFYFKKDYTKKNQILQQTAFCYYFWHFLDRLNWQVCFDLCISEIFCLICFCWKTIIYLYHSNIIYILRNLCLITLTNFVFLLNKLKLTHWNLKPSRF